MDRLTRVTALAVVALLVVSGRAAAADEPPAATPSAGMATIVAEAGAEVVFRALSLLGVRYQYGGNTPDTGLDCSGLVRLVFHETLGLPLPRRSEEISRVGGAVAQTDLQPGDLVFFNTLRRAFSHVGIYIGNNQFVHAPSSGGSIRVESLGSDYWVRRFDGGRRLVVADGAAAARAAAPASAPTGAPLVLASATGRPLMAPAPAAVPATVTPSRRDTASTAAPRTAPRVAVASRVGSRTATARRGGNRAQPVAVSARASGQPAGVRQRVTDLYVN